MKTEKNFAVIRHLTIQLATVVTLGLEKGLFTREEYNAREKQVIKAMDGQIGDVVTGLKEPDTPRVCSECGDETFSGMSFCLECGTEFREAG